MAGDDRGVGPADTEGALDHMISAGGALVERSPSRLGGLRAAGRDGGCEVGALIQPAI